MAGKPSPVTSSVLAWAVREDGRSAVEVATALRVDPDTLDEWMNDESKPTVGQVTKLATVLKRPRSMFFLPAPPTSASIPATFRHPPGDDRQVSSASRRRVRQARQVQLILEQALTDSPPVSLPRLRMDDTAPEEAAAQVRVWLGVTDGEQASWTNDYDGMYAWRRAIEGHGIFVFALDIGDRVRAGRITGSSSQPAPDVRGFSSWNEHAPVIVMNSKRVNAAARSFTMAHELGHLVTRQDAACIDVAIGPQFSEPVERWCEQFGAALLLPRRTVLAWARQEAVPEAGADLDAVTKMMRRFRTSARASALRLIDLGLAQRRLYPAVESAFRPREPVSGDKRKMSSDPRSVLRLRQFGPRALETVFGDIDPIEALSVFRMTVPDARDLAAQVPSAAVI